MTTDNYVLVLDTDKRALSPCHPARARELLDKGMALRKRQVRGNYERLSTTVVNREGSW